MKRIFLLFSAVVVAVLAGVAVFLWSGRTPSNIAEKGRKIEQSVQQMQQRGQQGVQQAHDIIKQIPIPDVLPGSQPATQPKKPEVPVLAAPQPQTPSPASQPPRTTTKPPVKTARPQGPPMEDVNHGDKEKLKNILTQ